MNIVPSYPNLVPLALQPAVEAARRDTQQRELIPAARQGEASAKESQAGSEKDKARSSDGAHSPIKRMARYVVLQCLRVW